MKTSEKNKRAFSIEHKTLDLIAAGFVRSLLLLHSFLATWRVTVAYEDPWMWCILFGNIPLIIEGIMVIKFNGGNEWKWWCPCFLLYLGSTIPSIWLLQLSQNDKLQPTSQIILTPQNYFRDAEPLRNVTVDPLANVSSSSSSVTPGSNFTENTTFFTTNSTLPITTTDPGIFNTITEQLLNLAETTWIVIMQELLMYLIVFGRWILPRAGVSRVALSDLLLVYLAMASDIMELYAVFDEQVVQENRNVTYAILTIWSISFLQFIPVLVQKNKYRHLQSRRLKKITRACGDLFSEVVTTVSSVVLQDGPFFCLRLYIMVRFQLVTYSLVFFVLKNFVSVTLLIYRLVILCLRLPCCYDDEKKKFEEFSELSRSSPIRHSDTFIMTNGRYVHKRPDIFQNGRPQSATMPHQTYPIFVIKTGKEKYIAQPGVVNRLPRKANAKPYKPGSF